MSAITDTMIYSQYLCKPGMIYLDQIIQQLKTNFLVLSKTFEDKLCSMNMVTGICECVRGCLKGPYKHMKAVAQKFKMNNFEMLPKENEIVRAFYHFIGTGIRRESHWLRP